MGSPGATDRAEQAQSRGCRSTSDGAKRRTAVVVSTTRRIDNGDDGRLGRRGYWVGVGGGGMSGMTTVAFDDGSGSSNGENNSWF